MNLATPAPRVESAFAEPASRETEESSTTRVEPPPPVEEAIADPASPVEPAETTDNPYKFAPSNAISFLEEKSKISVETLRQQGIDLECRVAIVKGGAPKKSWFKLMFPLFFDQRDFVSFSEIARYALIQRNYCFIYLESTDLNPLYAFDLQEIVAEIEDRDQPDKYSCTVNPCNDTNKTGHGLQTVLLRFKNSSSSNDNKMMKGGGGGGNGKQQHNIAYQFTFDVAKDPSIVKRFMDVVQQAATLTCTPQAIVGGQQQQQPTEKKKSKGK